MHQPPEYEDKSRPNLVCKLDKVLYGLNMPLEHGMLGCAAS